VKLSEATVEIEKSANLESGNFGIIFDAKMADMLSNKIYSDPIYAVVREYVCNAVDAHKMNRTTKAIDIALPTYISPVFVVRDYGPGLSQKDVMGDETNGNQGLFNTYGLSNKSHSNKAIGGFGLGSKAGFAYVKKDGAFTVTSYHGGEKKTYTCHRNENGIPCVTLMSTVKSSEHTGVSIAVPVNSNDSRTFADRLAKFACYLDTPLNITGATIKSAKPVYKFSGKTWGYEDGGYTRRSGKLIMGGIPYDLNQSIDPSFSMFYDIDVYAPIGSVEISVSREDLSYEDKTISFLRKEADRISKEIAVTLKDSIENAPTLVDASIAYSTIIGTRLGLKVAKDLPRKWKGQDLLWKEANNVTNLFKVYKNSRYNSSTGTYLYDLTIVGYGRYKDHKQYNDIQFVDRMFSKDLQGSFSTATISDKSWTSSFQVSLENTKTTVFVYCDTADKLMRRLNSVGKKYEATHKRFILIRGTTWGGFLKIITKVGRHVAYVKLSDYEPAKLVRTVSAGVKDKIRQVSTFVSYPPSYYNTNRAWYTVTDVDFADTSNVYYYLPTHDYIPNYEFGDNTKAFESIQKLYTFFNGKFKGNKLYFISHRFEKLAKANSKFVNLYDVIKRDIDAYEAQDKLMGLRQDVSVTGGNVLNTSSLHFLKRAIDRQPKLKNSVIKMLIDNTEDYVKETTAQWFLSSNTTYLQLCGLVKHTPKVSKRHLGKKVLDQNTLKAYIPILDYVDLTRVTNDAAIDNIIDLLLLNETKSKGNP